MSAGRVVITGGSRGIGKATAAVLAKSGWNVSLVGRDEGSLMETLSSLPGDGHTYTVCDLKTDSSLSNLATEVRRSGTISALVNCAGATLDKLLLRTTRDEMQSMLVLNAVAPMLLSRLFLPDLMRMKGSIVNVGSVVGEAGNSGQTAYSASKGALSSFTKSLAKEVGRKGVRVNTVAPGFIATSMTEGVMKEWDRKGKCAEYDQCQS
mmetsp:Transcript_45281/g.117201  ORF Transcript_45281/g.117201 Transcript_45281/m.117201 type:complete len:208 (-) Transcript_45281:97-720(-)